MTKGHYEKAYDKEYECNRRLIRFIENLESQTNEWDDLCDCPCNDGQCNGIHNDNCRTTNLRKDYHNLFNSPDL